MNELLPNLLIAVIAVALVILIVLSFSLRKGHNVRPPCKPGDCGTCLFPPCSEAERLENTGQYDSDDRMV